MPEVEPRNNSGQRVAALVAEMSEAITERWSQRMRTLFADDPVVRLRISLWACARCCR